jgi:hypothetical protein
MCLYCILCSYLVFFLLMLRTSSILRIFMKIESKIPLNRIQNACPTPANYKLISKIYACYIPQFLFHYSPGKSCSNYSLIYVPSNNVQHVSICKIRPPSHVFGVSSKCVLACFLGNHASSFASQLLFLSSSLSLVLSKYHEEIPNKMGFLFPYFDLMREGEESSNPVMEIRLDGKW